MRNFKTTATVLAWLGTAAFGMSCTEMAQAAMASAPKKVESPVIPSVADAQAKYDSLVKEATAAANKAIDVNKAATAALTDSTKAAAAAAAAKANAATAKKNFDTANSSYTKLVAAQTAADNAVKTAQTALNNNKDAKKTASLKAALDKATLTQKAAQTAADKGKQAVSDASGKYKDASASSDKAAASAKDYADKYTSLKKDADSAAAYAKSASDAVAAAKKVLDAAIAAAKSTGSSKVLSDTATNAAGLTFKEEVSEQLPRVMGAKGMDGPNVLTITDNGYESVGCRYGFQDKAFYREWTKGELAKGKVNSWKIRLEPYDGGNARYWITCQAAKGDKVIYSDTLEYIMQDRLSGTDWAKLRCDYPVSGKTDKFYITAALKSIKLKDPIYNVGLPLDPEAQKAFEIANQGKDVKIPRKGKANISRQPYEGNFGRNWFRFSSQNKKVTMSLDGKLLIVRRTWANPMSGCNLPAEMGAVKYQVTKKDPLRWVPNRLLTAVFVDGLKAALFPMNKKAPVKGAKNIYNTNAKIGTTFVMNSRGHGVLLDDSGAVQRKFTNGAKYLRRMMRHHWVEGEDNVEIRTQNSR